MNSRSSFNSRTNERQKGRTILTAHIKANQGKKSDEKLNTAREKR
jgi:hypothetical protein